MTARTFVEGLGRVISDIFPPAPPCELRGAGEEATLTVTSQASNAHRGHIHSEASVMCRYLVWFSCLLDLAGEIK